MMWVGLWNSVPSLQYSIIFAFSSDIFVIFFPANITDILTM